MIYESGNLFLVYDYNKSTLKSILSQDRTSNNFSEKHLLAILYNLLRVLKVMHSANLLNRGITPENIGVNNECQVIMLNSVNSRSMPGSCIGKGSGNSKRVRDSIY